jgi:hypothetical protein
MTATRIIWSEEMALVVARDLQAVQESFHEALENGGWVLIDADDGQKVSVNPAQVRYLEEVELTAGANGSRPQAQARPQPAAAR